VIEVILKYDLPREVTEALALAGDEKLYYAKSHGRNQVIHTIPETP
jgi:PleD family two-component response regulator